MYRTSSLAMLSFVLVVALGALPAYAIHGSAPIASVVSLATAAALASIVALSVETAVSNAPEPAVHHHA